jgi:two-component system phosphate regulon response regulator PhoB
MASRRRILIVEDDEDLRSLFRISLTLAGYEVQEAGDGLEALRQIDHSPPDLVVLDLMLPFVGGAVVRQEIATHVFTRDIPVVIITGSGRDLSGLAVACVLRKPVMPEELVRTVATCLGSGVRGSTS